MINDWSQYKATPIGNSEESTVEKSPIQNQSNDTWSQYSAEPIKEPSFGEKIIEGAEKGTRWALEGALGFPGNIEALGRYGLRKFEEKTGLKPRFEVSGKNILPTTEELHQLGKEEFGEKYEPKGKIEEIGKELIQDYIFAPGGPLKKVAVSGAGILAQESLKAIGASQNAQNIGKTATTFLGSLAGKKNVKDYYRDEYTKASIAISSNKIMDSKSLMSELTHLENTINKGISTTAKDPALKAINELKSKASSGQVAVEEIDRAFHDIGQIMLDKKNLAPTAEKFLIETKEILRKNLNKYGATNPKYLNAFNNANAAFAGLAQNQKAVNAVKKWTKSGIITGVTALSAELYFMGPEATVGTLGAVAGAYGLANSYDLMKRIVSNKTLFHYYSKAAAAAATDNLPQFTKNMTRLDHKLKSENTNSSKFADVIREKRVQKSQ